MERKRNPGTIVPLQCRPGFRFTQPGLRCFLVIAGLDPAIHAEMRLADALP
jgi:hypothetical protein